MSTNKEMIQPQPTEQNPLTVEDYPYGWRQRTKAQYWTETTEYGQRIIFRTLNPKTQQWNKPKKGIYSDILVLYRNTENGHIENDGLSFAYCDEERLNKFLADFPEQTLSDYQRHKLIYLRAIIKTRKHVTVKTVTNPTLEQAEQIKKHSEETMKEAHKIFSYYYAEEKKKAETHG
jgi:hypothetical protein